MGDNKLMGIGQIVKLKEFLQRWQKVTVRGSSHTHKRGGGGGGIHLHPAISKRLKGNYTSVYSDSDNEDGSQSLDLPQDVPKGYLAIYVGPQLRRFIIPTTYLGDPLFRVLLEKAEEEFGFDHNGALTIPCEIETFSYLLKCMERKTNQGMCYQHAYAWYFSYLFKDFHWLKLTKYAGFGYSWPRRIS